ncbi:class A sortase [Bacillus sp. FSL W7-1360]
MRKKLGLVLLLIGILIITYQPIMNHVISPYFLKRAQANMLQLSNEQLRENQTISFDDAFRFEDIDQVSVLDPFFTVDTSRVLGEISIPSVHIHLPILYGTTNETLKVGAGTMKPEQKMGAGNYALASHNSRNQALLFAPLRNMEEGDTIYIRDDRYTYEYEMISKEIVDPTRVDVIEDRGDTPIITLVSCYSEDGSDRIIITGELVNKK